MDLGYCISRAVMKHVLVNTFFRQIDVVGGARIPETGPLIFVANHNNQFVDPMMLVTRVNRVIRFLIAAKSLARPIIGAWARSCKAIRVMRAQDAAFNGIGKVSFEAGSVIIVGEGTSFKKDLHPGAKVKAGGIELSVKTVESDTRCISTEEAASTVTSSEYKVCPKIDQSAMYAQVHQALINGDCIGIFPEGGSHDQASMIELKPGVAIMALGAMQAGAQKVRIVPCGLNYFDPNVFRSRVTMEFGEPFEVPQALVDLYRTNKRAAVSELMVLVDDAMHGVMPGAKDWEELQSLLTMRALYKPRGTSHSAEETLKLNKMFALSRKRFFDDPRMSGLVSEVHEYVELLRAAGLRDRDVRLSLVRDSRQIWLTVSAAFQLVLLSPISIPMVILYFPVALLTRTLAERERKTALANSTVKLTGNDVVASYKLIVGVVFLPLYNLALAVIATLYFHVGCLCFLFIYFIGVPFVEYVGIRVCDHSVRCWRRVRAICLFWGCSATATILHQFFVERRKSLQEKVTAFVKEVGPQMSQDLEQQKQIQARTIACDMERLQSEGVLSSRPTHAAQGGEGGLAEPLLPKTTNR